MLKERLYGIIRCIDTCENPLRRRTKATILAFLLFVFIFMKNVSAVTYSVGVNVNDWAEYIFSFEWSSNPPQPEPEDVEQEKQVNYTRVEVKEISGTTVTVHRTIYFKNGSKQIDVLFGDVKKCTGNLTVQIIAPNLKEGDPISEGQDSPVINRTLLEKYAGATREANVVRVEVGIPGDLGNWSIIDLYWDKETGFLCELAILSDVFSENYEVTSFTKWKMIKTNLWEPETNIAISEWAGVIVSVIIVIVVIYFVFKRPSGKRLKRRRLKNR